MSDSEKSPPKCCAIMQKCNPIPQRFIIALMGCLGVVNAYTMRQCLSVSMTQIVLPRNYTDKQIKEEVVCKADHNINEGKANKGNRDWNQAVQSWIFAAFYVGYIFTHLPGGILATRFGSKWVLSLGVLSTATFTLLTPWIIEHTDYLGLIIFRFLMGIGEGTTFPALAVLLADWIPLKERGILGSIVFGGGQIGSMLSNSITGWMAVKYSWPTTFYVWGFVAVVWFFFFIILCYNSPVKHPCIREKERNKLKEELGEASSKRKDLPPPPFKQIFSGAPMWTLITAQIGHDWAFFILVTYLPKYMNDVLQMQIKNNGILSALPSLVMWLGSIISGVTADALIKSGKMSITAVRKLMTGLAGFVPAIFLIAASYSGCNRIAVVINFCLSMGFMGAYYGGMKLMANDMSPNYAGILMGITNGFGALTGAVAPTIAGWMTPNTTMQEWRLVFWVAFAVLIVTSVIYCIWADCEVQSWNEPEKAKEETKGK